MAQLADLLIDRMRDEGAFAAPEPEPDVIEPVLTPPPTTDVALSDEEGSAAAETLGGTDVQLEAKGGEAYEEVVVTASRQAQSPLDAPNAVTILTEEDIRLYGVRTVPELLRRVPGMDVMAMSYSEHNVAMRGFNRRLANKILVLIDGRTAYVDFLGATLWRALPIDILDIERIEVVRGPGSAIYGAYAYTGIINIITKRPELINGSVAQVTAGNGEQLAATYQFGQTSGPFGVRITAGYDQGNKYEVEFGEDRVDTVQFGDDPNRSLEMLRVEGEAEYNVPDSSSRIYLGGHVTSGLNELFGVATLRNLLIDSNQYGVRAGFNSDLFSVRAFWNHLDTESNLQAFPLGTPGAFSRTKFDLVSLEPVFRPQFDFLGKHAVVLGGEYRFKRIEWPEFIGPNQTENHFALFFQDSWGITDELTTIISGRLDLHPLIGPLGSPRVAFIYKPTPTQAIRLSIGTAFRQPTMAETYIDLTLATPVVGAGGTLSGGQDQLDPEAIATIDVGYRNQQDWGDFEFVGYVNRVTDLIVRTPLVPSAPNEGFSNDTGVFPIGSSNYINDPDTYLSFGTELSAVLYPLDGIDIGANYAFQYIFDSDTGDRFTDSPLHKFSIWGALRTELGLDVAVSAHFVSDQNWIEQTYDLDDPSGFDNTPLPLDASVVVMGRVGYRMLDGQLELSVTGANLTDFGGLRHREHPFGNRLDARIYGQALARF